MSVPKPQYEPYDSPLRWKIDSKTNSHVCYIVDLGLEECQCKFHQCEVGPKLKKGLRPKFCSHFYIAEERFKNWAKWMFHKQDPNRKHDDNI